VGPKTEAEQDVVEAILKQFEQVGSCGAVLVRALFFTYRTTGLEIAVVEAKLLRFFEADGIPERFATGWPMFSLC